MLCAKCKTQEQVGTGPYCAPCRAAYQRDYRKTSAKLKANEDFRRGAEVMRAAICKSLSECGLEQFNGRTAAAFAQAVECSTG